MATDLPEPVVPAISRCGIFARSATTGVAADVLAERERERRRQLVIGARAQDLAERHQLARLVRDLEADHGLARDDLDDAHADRRQRAREVLGEGADLADLDAGRRLQLEARDHRTRLHGDDLDIDAEVLQLDLDQPRDRIERFRRIGALARRRLVEQLEFRQVARRRLGKELHLPFLLDAPARFRHRRRGQSRCAAACASRLSS